MKRKKVVLSLAAACLFSASAAAYGVARAAQAKRGGGRSQAERGRAVYEARCTRCHGADGAGRTRMADIVEPPDMSDPAWQRQRGDARMIASVANGRGQMPAFRKKLSRQEIAAAVAYVRTLGR
ncbi:MAG TPA: cytochrome c [Pyrinomonadaceae bacterium]|jgi:mono/diheme cytochrome c family protein